MYRKMVRPVMIFTLILIIISFTETNSNYMNSTLTEHDDFVYQKYNELDKNLKRMVNSAVKYMFPYAMEAMVHLNISSQCINDGVRLILDLRKLKLSALSFLDASGKFPGGILLGRIFILGDYDECLNATATYKNGDVAFKGQYCIVKIKPLLPKLKKYVTISRPDEQLLEATKNTSEFMKYVLNYLPVFYLHDMKLGICAPTGCSTSDINEVLRYLSEQLSINMKVDYCDYDGKYPAFRPRMIFAICSLLVLGLLVSTGTVVEYYCKERHVIPKNLAVKMLICFSVITNIPKLLSTKTSENTLNCLYGVRALCLFYVILQHQYYFAGLFTQLAHTTTALKEVSNFFLQIITNGLLIVDFFFFLGGLLNCYDRMKMNENTKEKEKPLKMLLHKVIRIYPALLLITFVIPNILDHAYGPQREILTRMFRNCDNNWWKNLLFINNFFDLWNTVCMFQTWFFSADMQLFIISLFTIPVLMRNARTGILLHLVIIFCGITVSSVWALHKGIHPTLLYLRMSREDIHRFWNAYASTPPHVATYFTGVLIGYFLYVKKSLKIPKVYQFIGWPVVSLLFVSMLFVTMGWNSGTQYTALEGVFYYSFSRPAFLSGFAWIIICCVTGHGGFFNYVLSLKVWIPIARISYMTYLVSFTVQLFYEANLRLVSDFHRMVLIWRHLGDIVVSCMIGAVLVVIVESPIIALEKLLLPGIYNQGWKVNDHKNEKDNHVIVRNFENNNVLEKENITNNSKH